MNKWLCVIVILGSSFILRAQIDVKGSMGINLISIPGVRDYLNTNFAPSDQQLSSFSTSIAFDVEAGYRIENTQYALDLGLETNSFNFDLYGSKYNLAYTTIQPSAMIYTVMAGEGYKFKFGGGIGPRFLTVYETIPPIQEVKYTATGWGILGRIDAGTALSRSTFAYIGGDIGYNHYPVPQNGSQKMGSTSINATGVKFSEFFVGIKLGVIYSF